MYTVDKLVKELQKLQEQGLGSRLVVVSEDDEGNIQDIVYYIENAIIKYEAKEKKKKDK